MARSLSKFPKRRQGRDRGAPIRPQEAPIKVLRFIQAAARSESASLILFPLGTLKLKGEAGRVIFRATPPLILAVSMTVIPGSTITSGCVFDTGPKIQPPLPWALVRPILFFDGFAFAG